MPGGTTIQAAKDRTRPDVLADSVGEILSWLRTPEVTPTRDEASNVRDRAAAFLGSDPSLAQEMALALEDAAFRLAKKDHSYVQAVALRARAEASVFLGRIQEATELYLRANELALHAKAPALRGQILVGWIGVLAALGHSTRAKQLARTALDLLERARDRVYVGKLHMNLGNLAYHTERYEEANRRYTLSAKAFQAAGITDATWVGLLINQAVANTNLDRYEEARALFQRAEARCRELGLVRLRGQTLFDLAFLERARGDYRESLRRLDDAEAIAARLDARELAAGIHRERAMTYLDLGMPSEAAEFARAAVVSFESEGLQLDANLARLSEAWGLFLFGRTTDAAELIDRAIEFFRTEGYATRVADARLHRARALLHGGRFAEAAADLHSARRRLGPNGPASLVVRLECLAAEKHLATRRWAHAAAATERALRHGTKLSLKDRAEVFRLAGTAARGRGDLAGAKRWHVRAVRAVEAQQQLIPGVEYRAAAFERHAEAYEELVETLVAGATDFDELFEAVEAGRARAFWERARASRSGQDPLAELRTRLGATTRRLEEAELEKRDGSVRSARVVALRRLVLALERRIAEEVRRSSARQPEQRPGRPRTSAEAVMAALGPGGALVELAVLRERIVAIVLRRNVRSFDVLDASPALLARQTARVRHQLESMALMGESTALDPEFLLASANAALQEIYDALLAPLAPRLRGVTELVIVPHRGLHVVPFECLHDGNEYLDERCVISRSPTASFVARAKRRQAATGGVLLSATARGGPPSAVTEVERVAAMFGDARPAVRIDLPTAQWLAEARGARIVHLSAHGVFRGDNPLFSRISMGDGALFMADVLFARMRAELVVLSACNTGQVFGGRGESLSGVSHAFLAAGARHLVASHWRVHDEATADLMCAFYAAHLAGAGPAAALASARRSLRQTRPHPFYWGGFAVHGA